MKNARRPDPAPEPLAKSRLAHESADLLKSGVKIKIFPQLSLQPPDIETMAPTNVSELLRLKTEAGGPIVTHFKATHERLNAHSF